MDKLKIREAILVEGKYDKIKLSSLVEGAILETGGFSLFHDQEKLALLRRFAQSRGLVILTDSDGAGLLIRGRIHSLLPGVTVKHAYVPELAGKEKRKRQASKAGLLGVEGMSLSVLRTALERAGATLEEENAAPQADTASPGIPSMTKGDLYTLGLSGTPQSAQRRKALCLALGLPQNISANRLLEAINGFYTKDEILETMAHLNLCAHEEDPPYGAHKKTD